ncbi:hypothetical protein KKC88_05010 [Patescibacteria group bacterium]|nr:hypothetical protein [Patescibacteria group bacterium]MBU1673261.1 hypothetical protein [Patescibacteria group bacterium]MBU1963522.1 hypothetical protein [Patescibacteria group bacterium]
MKIGGYLLILCFGIFGAAGMAMAADLYVDDDGCADIGNCQTAGSPCCTINYAIGQGANGDSMSIAAGTYFEDVNLIKEIDLLGAGRTQTIIDCSGASPVDHCIDANALSDAVIIQDLQVTGAGTGKAGIWISPSATACPVVTRIWANRNINNGIDSRNCTNYTLDDVWSTQNGTGSNSGIQIIMNSSGTLQNSELAGGPMALVSTPTGGGIANIYQSRLSNGDGQYPPSLQAFNSIFAWGGPPAYIFGSPLYYNNMFTTNQLNLYNVVAPVFYNNMFYGAEGYALRRLLGSNCGTFDYNSWYNNGGDIYLDQCSKGPNTNSDDPNFIKTATGTVSSLTESGSNAYDFVTDINVSGSPWTAHQFMMGGYYFVPDDDTRHMWYIIDNDENTLNVARPEIGYAPSDYGVGASDTFYVTRFIRDNTWSGVDNGLTIAAVTIDIMGTARPQGSGYDIGPYESDEEPPGPGVPEFTYFTLILTLFAGASAIFLIRRINHNPLK